MEQLCDVFFFLFVLPYAIRWLILKDFETKPSSRRIILELPEKLIVFQCPCLKGGD